MRSGLFLLLTTICAASCVGQPADTVRHSRTTYSYGIQFRGAIGLGSYEVPGDFVIDNEVHSGTIEGLLALHKGSFDCALTVGLMPIEDGALGVYGVQIGWDFLSGQLLHYSVGLGGISGRSNLPGYQYATGGAYGMTGIGVNIRPGSGVVRVRPELFVARVFTDGDYVRENGIGLRFDESQGVGLTMVGIKLSIERFIGN